MIADVPAASLHEDALLYHRPCVAPTGPDGRTYRVDWSVRFDCAVGTLGGTVPSSATCTGTGASETVKRVTVVVYDPTTTPVTELFRETSTFDQATG